MAWDLWVEQTEAGDKLQLRQAYYGLDREGKLSNEEFIATAQSRLNRTRQSVEQSYGAARDCLAFKAYAVGYERSQISSITSNPSFTELTKIEKLAELVNALDPNNFEINQPPFGAVFLKYNVNNARSDSAIKAFLNAERALQQSGGTSVFTSALVTGETAIANSILGFASDTEKQDYFASNYPDDELPTDTIKNKLTIKDMYEVDRMYAKSNRIEAGAKGHLFCRTSAEYEIINSSGGGDTYGTYCWRDVYAARGLDYRLIIENIDY